jgi:predicted CopG family antitoxin
MVERLRAMRDPDESYSDVILRLVEVEVARIKLWHIDIVPPAPSWCWA